MDTVTRFVENSPVCRNFKSSEKCIGLLFSIGQILILLWQCCFAIGQILLQMAKIEHTILPSGHTANVRCILLLQTKKEIYCLTFRLKDRF